MKPSLSRVKDKISENKSVLRDSYNVSNIGVFGSVARTDATEKSDIDVLVEFSEPIGLFKFVELQDFLTKILDRKVDLVTKKALKPIIKDEILREVVYV